MKTLTNAAFQQARNYIFTQGRPLDQQLFTYHFADGDAAAVLSELARFQNDDGGFGNALEPDVRTPASSAVATQVAFNILREVDAPSNTPIVQRAVQYLLESFDTARQVWPIVPAAVEDAPHAWWWNYADIERNFGGFIINPRAALVGFLHRYADLVPPDFLSTITDSVLAHLETMPDDIKMFDFFCYMALAGSSNLPTTAHAQIRTKLLCAIPQLVETDPSKWIDYVVTPLEIAPNPGAMLADAVDRTAIDANLDYLIDTQLADGAWPIPWSWADNYPEAWAQAERDWKGHHIVRDLCVLQAYSRIEV